MIKLSAAQVATYVGDVDIEAFVNELRTWQMDAASRPPDDIQDTIIATLDTVLDILIDCAEVM
jgi:hypothetical protein